MVRSILKYMFASPTSRMLALFLFVAGSLYCSVQELELPAGESNRVEKGLPIPSTRQERFSSSSVQIRPCFDADCEHWLDTKGDRIEAHGAGILYNEKDQRWYWYGESKKTESLADHGFNCYSSDTVSGPWRFESMVLSQEHVKANGFSGPFVIERPKVIFNRKKDEFVMWFHLDSSDYRIQLVGVATAGSAAGPFSFVRGFLPDGLASLDMSLYVDYDGTAYFVRSIQNEYFAISYVADDMLSTTGILSVGSGNLSRPVRGLCLEGFALFRHPYEEGGTLYMMTSHCDWWRPTALVLLKAKGPSLKDPQWVSLQNPTNHRTSYNSQPNFVVPFKAADGQSYPIYLGDNWVHAGGKVGSCRPVPCRSLINAAYVWLPLRIADDGYVSMPKLKSWYTANPFSGKEFASLNSSHPLHLSVLSGLNTR